MQLGEISFCDKIGYNVKQDAYKESILNELDTNYKFKVIQRHHENFDPNSTATQRRINTIPHMVSTKTNGNPYLLYLTRYNFANQCIFIDKKIQHGYFLPRMICVKLWFNDRLFENTLFDGEMVKDKDDNWTYIINDIIAKENNPLSGLKLVQRINIIYSTLKDNYYEDKTACCCLAVKRYFKVDEIPQIMSEFIPSLNYTCRGLYFKPIYSNYKDLLYNFNPSLIKSVVRMKFNDLSKKTFLSRQDEVGLKMRSTVHEEMNEMKDMKGKTVPHDDNKRKRKEGEEGERIGIVRAPQSKESKESLPPEGLATNEKVFSVRKTKTPDVYEMQMYTRLKSDHGENNENGENGQELSHSHSYSHSLSPSLVTACVQDRKTSSMMRSVFNNLTFLEKLDFVCTYNLKFNKWQPLRIVE